MGEEEKSVEQRSPLEECAAQLSSAAGALERVIGKLEAQYEALNQKIDRIIATVEKLPLAKSEEKVEAGVEWPSSRRTLPPMVNALLAKSGVHEAVPVESSVLDRALAGLTIEQRMAVKAELARAGMIA